MSRSFTWAGFRATPNSVLEKLQLTGTGEFKELPEVPTCGVMLESGWFVVVAQDQRFLDRTRLEDLSFDGDVVAASIDEKTHISQAMAWRNSALVWSVIHDRSVSRTHLQMEGAPPREVHTLIETARLQPHPFVDHFFSVPVDLMESVIGFAFGGDQRFETLTPHDAPWRAFQHHDGRVWSVRVGGAGYQLRVGAENDDPVFKERSSTRPLRDIEALIAEQVSDGFSGK